MAGKNQGVLLMASLVVAAIFGCCSAVTHTVGGNTGWTIPPSASFYSNWAAGQTFSVGDVLVFSFRGHTVAQVNQANFNACNTANNNIIGPVLTTSPANVTLTTAGAHFFICTIPGHCLGNQKLSVVVTGPSAAAPSGGATAPTAGPTAPTGGVTSPSGSPTNPSTTSAPPPSFATSTSVGLLSVVSVAVAAALMF